MNDAHHMNIYNSKSILLLIIMAHVVCFWEGVGNNYSCQERLLTLQNSLLKRVMIKDPEQTWIIHNQAWAQTDNKGALSPLHCAAITRVSSIIQPCYGT